MANLALIVAKLVDEERMTVTRVKLSSCVSDSCVWEGEAGLPAGEILVEQQAGLTVLHQSSARQCPQPALLLLLLPVLEMKLWRSVRAAVLECKSRRSVAPTSRGGHQPRKPDAGLGLRSPAGHRCKTESNSLAQSRGPSRTMYLHVS